MPSTASCLTRSPSAATNPIFLSHEQQINQLSTCLMLRQEIRPSNGCTEGDNLTRKSMRAEAIIAYMTTLTCPHARSKSSRSSKNAHSNPRSIKDYLARYLIKAEGFLRLSNQPLRSTMCRVWQAWPVSAAQLASEEQTMPLIIMIDL